MSFPDGLTTIGDGAFYWCHGPTSVTLPGSLTSIGGSAFQGCRGLTSATLLDGLTSIGDYAFSGSTGLTSVTCMSQTPPSASYEAFGRETYASAALHVPSGTADAYKSADCWEKFSKLDELKPTGLKDVPTGIEKPGVIYDLYGHRLAKPRRGVNIVNRRKELVR